MRACVSVSPVAADRGPCRDLLRILPWEKTFRLAKTNLEATSPHQHGKSTVAASRSRTYLHKHARTHQTHTHTLKHSQTNNSQESSEGVISLSQRLLSQQHAKFHDLRWIRTHDPSNQLVADPQFKRHDHRDRLQQCCATQGHRGKFLRTIVTWIVSINQLDRH